MEVRIILPDKKGALRPASSDPHGDEDAQCQEQHPSGAGRTGRGPGASGRSLLREERDVAAERVLHPVRRIDHVSCAWDLVDALVFDAGHLADASARDTLAFASGLW